jgi:hypothetical protein
VLEGCVVALTYAIVTPARNEAETLPRLPDALRRQTIAPVPWLIVESANVDGKRSEPASRATGLAVADAPGERGCT